MNNPKELKLSDLLEMEKLEKPEENGVRFVFAGEALTSEGLSAISEKIDDNDDIKSREVIKPLKNFVESMAGVMVDYFGDLISLEEFKKIPQENIKVCEQILRRENRDGRRLTFVPIKVLNELVKYQDLDLGSLRTLSAKVAEVLGNYCGNLYLNGISKISDGKIMESLSKHQGWLFLNGLKEITDDNAKALSKHQGDLFLNGLKELSEKAAEFLGQHEGCLYLDGLIKLPERTAKWLIKHQGPLHLNGLKEIDDEVAKELGKYKGSLSLNGLVKISDKAAEELGNHQGKLKLGLRVLGLKVAEGLSKNKGKLHLWVNKITAQEIGILAKNCKDLELRVKNVDEKACRELVKNQQIYVFGLSDKSRELYMKCCDDAGVDVPNQIMFT